MFALVRCCCARLSCRALTLTGGAGSGAPGCRGRGYARHGRVAARVRPAARRLLRVAWTARRLALQRLRRPGPRPGASRPRGASRSRPRPALEPPRAATPPLTRAPAVRSDHPAVRDRPRGAGGAAKPLPWRATHQGRCACPQLDQKLLAAATARLPPLRTRCRTRPAAPAGTHPQRVSRGPCP